MIQHWLYGSSNVSYHEIFNPAKLNNGIELYTGIYNTMATFDFTTNSQKIKLKYNCTNNTFPGYSNIAFIKIDGIISTISVSGNSYFEVDTGNTSTKTIQIANNYIELSSIWAGCFLQSVMVLDDNVLVIKEPAPTERILYWGDSIGQGARATNILTDSFAMLHRNHGYNVSVGGASIYSITLMYDGIAKALDWINIMMDGTTENKLVFILGTNDYLQDPAIINTKYNAIVDAIHTLRPDIHVYCCKPYPRTDDGNLPQIRTNIATTVSNRSSYCTLIDLSTSFDVATETLDGLHPLNSAHIKINNIIEPALV